MKITAIISTLTLVVVLNHIVFSTEYWILEDYVNIIGSNVQDRASYVTSKLEKYFLDHAVQLGYHVTHTPPPQGCAIWYDNTTEIYDDLMRYRQHLKNHTQAIQNFEPIPDLLQSIISSGSHDVCETARPHPQGLEALFPGDDIALLSKTSSGYVEPLTTPMRSPEFCFNIKGRVLMNIDGLIHDFEAMCRNLKPHSKRIFIDLGASLRFGGVQPGVALLDTYEKFGFKFDHIYAFEKRFWPPEHVYKNLLPEKYFSSYHYINVGKNKKSFFMMKEVLLFICFVQ